MGKEEIIVVSNSSPYYKKKQVNRLPSLIKDLRESGFFIGDELYKDITKEISKFS